MKRNYRFTLHQARLPEIFNEAETKISQGIKPGDVILDLLTELYWRRQLGQSETATKPEQADSSIDFDEAARMMDSLLD